MITVSIVKQKRRGGESKNWYLRWTDPETGKRRKLATKFTQEQLAKGAAVDFARELELGIAMPQLPKSKNATYGEFVEEFITVGCAAKTAGTRKTYRDVLTQFGNLMQPATVKAVTEQLVLQFIALRRDKLQPATIDKYLRHLGAFLKYAEGKTIAKGSAPNLRKMFLTKDEGEKVVIPDEHIAAILAAVPNTKLTQCSVQWWDTFIRSSLFLGTRAGELLGLTWGCLDFKTKQIRILGGTSKTGRKRTYEAADLFDKVLVPWRDAQTVKPSPSDKVLPYAMSRKALYWDWGKIMLKAGLGSRTAYCLKNLRSTCATQMHLDGENDADAAEWLGHSVKVYQAYYCSTSQSVKNLGMRRKVV